jgi:hypothetical protein
MAAPCDAAEFPTITRKIPLDESVLSLLKAAPSKMGKAPQFNVGWLPHNICVAAVVRTRVQDRVA